MKISIAMHPLIRRALGSQIKVPVSGMILVDSPVVNLAIAVAFIHLYNAFCMTVTNWGSVLRYCWVTVLAKLSIVLGTFVEAFTADNAQSTKHWKKGFGSWVVRERKTRGSNIHWHFQPSVQSSHGIARDNQTSFLHRITEEFCNIHKDARKSIYQIFVETRLLILRHSTTYDSRMLVTNGGEHKNDLG